MAKEYDVIVIGGGLGGLACGALTANAGLSTALIEQGHQVGGYATDFRRDGFLFDSAVHLIGRCAPGGSIYNLLERLGIADRVGFLRVEPLHRYIFPEHDLRVPSDLKEYQELLEGHFPKERIGKLFEAMAGLAKEAARAGRGLRPQELATLPLKHPLLFKYHNKPLQSFLDDYTRDKKLQAIFTASWGYYGLPPERLATLYFVGGWYSYHAQGGFVIKGGAQVLSDALADAMKTQGGEVLLKTRVKRIILEGGRAAGVELADGAPLKARYVVSNASAPQTYLELIGREHLSKDLIEQLESWELSASAFQLYLGVELDLKVPDYTLFITDTYDHSVAYRDLMEAEPGFLGYSATIYTNVEPERAPAGHHVIHLITLASYGPWRAALDSSEEAYREMKAHWAERLLERAEVIFPGLKAGIRVQEVATPLTMERYTLNTKGAIYGWAQTVEQSGLRRPQVKSPIPGLYQAGAWAFPGGGVAAVIPSGALAARALLKEAGVADT
ncbi:MAG: phytoene desaturase family protein [Candidatus Bipolaricaulia bacterium]